MTCSRDFSFFGTAVAVVAVSILLIRGLLSKELHMDSRGTGQQGPRSLLRMSAVTERVGLRRSTIYRLVAEGSFPAPVRLLSGRRGSRWDSVAIDQWIAAEVNRAQEGRSCG